MIKEITIDQLDELENPLFLDVRSEAEFQEATIPGSINLPLLNNDERELVGTVYTQNSPREARDLGLKLISPKLPQLTQRAAELSSKGQLVVFCWRGGMRSKSFATILDLMGYRVFRLQGGYKAYRKHVINYFETRIPFHVIVLRGNTGVGKTEIISQLIQEGYPAVDLEGIANNRGSVFGAMGLGEAPTQKMFESLLYQELIRFKNFKYIIVECESKRIGRVTLPNHFFTAMQDGLQILVYDNIDNRIMRLIKEYTTIPNATEEIRSAVLRLNKRLGTQTVREYLDLLASQNFSEFARRILVEYYDKLYAYPNEPSSKYTLSVSNSIQGVKELKFHLEQKYS